MNDRTKLQSKAWSRLAVLALMLSPALAAACDGSSLSGSHAHSRLNSHLHSCCHPNLHRGTHSTPHVYPTTDTDGNTCAADRDSHPWVANSHTGGGAANVNSNTANSNASAADSNGDVNSERGVAYY